MSFGGLFEGGTGAREVAAYGSSAMAGGQQRLVQKNAFSSPALSLALRTNSERNPMAAIGGAGLDSMERNNGVNNREDEIESRSGSDNLEGNSGDDLDQDNPRKRKRYHRHTPQQIQELEALFKECPHPDEKQRLELSRRLSLESRQVKFWFQNRRTQMKTQIERHENTILRQENDKLRAENMSMREAMRNPMCNNCGSPAMIGESSLEEQHLRIENARLKEELDRVCTLAGKFLGRPVSSLTGPNASLELGVGNNGFTSLNSMSSLPEFTPIGSSPRIDRSLERSMFLEVALSAMDELVKMAQMEEPLWLPSLDGGGKETLNFDEYHRVFPRCIGIKPAGFISEASRETGMVIINSLALVETLMDATRWADMFPCIIARAAVTDIISSGMGGTRNGSLQLMRAELQVLSPLVPIREVNFLRFCKQHAEGIWAVVDVSIDAIRENNPPPGTSFTSCRRMPSGCLVQDMPNGYSKVTWVEHAEYDETAVHLLYRGLLRSGMGLGAQRWLATLQRQCECLAILMSSSVVSQDPSAITQSGRRSMLKLAQRMTANFCAGVCASSIQKWSELRMPGVGEDVSVLTRQSVDDPGEPPGVVLSAATSVWLAASPHRVFDFLRDERIRSEWDILSNGGPMQEMAHIAKGQDNSNAVSLLRTATGGTNQSGMLILQETCMDASGSMVVYAPVDIPAMHTVMTGGDSSYVALLPSGFVILPDSPGNSNAATCSGSPTVQGGGGGCLLTVAFQILVNSLPTAKLTVESVETVNNLIGCTVEKIKAAVLQCEN
ncbi:hypothetical protein J5N97_025324 [Dioscorea zingiberensis]|uniref:Homeobox-leucine zipper protein ANTHOCYANINLESS 2 n=1 Tax=Dioscorea zingiberensis TaxID=325984 RepID=A0A9D5C827_9LILI|nr:hypothetical protein J5N97_025297 [Dioscorea zingiberensis]KAJ0968407.1 hypothetical protein J5N97_025324 [Dioscorea zingiberensis]